MITTGTTGDTLVIDAVSGGEIDSARSVNGATPFTVDIVLTAAPDAHRAFQARFTWDPAILSHTGTPVVINMLGSAGLCGPGTYNGGPAAPSLFDGCARGSGAQPTRAWRSLGSCSATPRDGWR